MFLAATIARFFWSWNDYRLRLRLVSPDGAIPALPGVGVLQLQLQSEKSREGFRPPSFYFRGCVNKDLET